MKTLAEKVIAHLIDDGCEIEVMCEGELDLEKSTSFKEVIEAVEAVDCLSNIIAYKKGEYACTFVVSLDGFEPEETVIDYGVNDYSEAIYNKYSLIEQTGLCPKFNGKSFSKKQQCR